MTALGATLVAVSPQLPDFSRAMITKADLTFPVLSDVGNQVARHYRLVITVPEHLRPYGISLPEFNGDDSWELPMTGTFVIGQDGIIHLAPFGTPPMDIIAGQQASGLLAHLPSLPMGTPQVLEIVLFLFVIGGLIFLAARVSRSKHEALVSKK